MGGRGVMEIWKWDKNVNNSKERKWGIDLLFC